LNNKKPNNLTEKHEPRLNRHLTKEDTEMPIERCPTSHVIRELQVETTVKYHSIPIRKLHILGHLGGLRGRGATGVLIHCWGECNMTCPLWKTVGWFLTKRNLLLPYDPASAKSLVFSQRTE
ncbi:LORF2 protein, partial [Crocuta crocuta]